MNFTNASLSTVATALAVLGVQAIEKNLLQGAIELVLAIAVFYIYEKTPSGPTQ